MTELSMGPSRMEGAYEIAEILTNSQLVDKWLDEAEELPHTLMHTVAGWYLYSPRIAVEDIASCRIEARGARFALIVKIRRGKDILAAFFNQHERVMAGDHESGEGLCVWCEECKTKVDLPWDSFGHLGGTLVREAVKSCNAEASASKGPIQRAVELCNPDLVEERGA